MSDRFDPWPFLRDILIQGRYIAQDYDGESYERYSARLDAAARELADRLRPHLAHHPADDAEPADATWMKSIPEPAKSRIPSWRDYGDHGFEVFVRLPGNAELMVANPTRGQLRRLFGVFGMEVGA